MGDTQKVPESQLPEQLYGMRAAAEAIPMPTMNALYCLLSKHRAEFPPRYRRRHWYVERFLTASEIHRLRELSFASAVGLRRGRPGGRMAMPSGPLGAIARRAMNG